MTEISVSPEVLRQKYNEIAVLDEKIAAASGSENAGKRAVANAIANETVSVWQPIATQVTDHMETLETDNLVGAFTGLISALRDKFGDSVDEYLVSQVEARKVDVPEVSEDELNAFLAERKELNEEYKALRNILEMFGQDVDDIPVPKKMTGSRGPRGPRTLSKFDYSIDGEARSKSQNSLSSIANTVCKDLNWKTKDLREFLVSQGLDLENPGDSWSYTLPNGKVLSAVKSEETDEYEATDDDEDEDTDED